jgi:hypothetical protein
MIHQAQHLVPCLKAGIISKGQEYLAYPQDKSISKDVRDSATRIKELLDRAPTDQLN